MPSPVDTLLEALALGAGCVLFVLCALALRRERRRVARLRHDDARCVLRALLSYRDLPADELADALEVPAHAIARWSTDGVPAAHTRGVRALGRVAALHFGACPAGVAAPLLIHCLRLRSRMRTEQRVRRLLLEAGPDAARTFARLTHERAD